MLVPYIRSSSYGTWDTCQLKYYQVYGLGWDDKTNLKAELGTATHKVMEVLGNCKKILQDGGKQVFVDDALGEIKFTKKGLYTEQFVQSLIDRSYEHYKSISVNDFDKKSFTVKVEDENINNTKLFVEKMCHRALYSWNGAYDPRNRTIVDMEPHFDLPINEEWAYFDYEVDGKSLVGQLAIKGTIDTVTSTDDDTIEVIDWKTGQRTVFSTGEEKTYAKLQKDPQLLLYNHAISRLYPKYSTRIMTINFLRDGGPFSMIFDDDDDAMFLKMLKDRFNEIKNAKTLYPVSNSRTSWKCKYLCAFSDIDPETGKTICHGVEDSIKTYGIDVTTSKLKKKNFDPKYYSAPG